MSEKLQRLTEYCASPSTSQHSASEILEIAESIIEESQKSFIAYEDLLLCHRAIRVVSGQTEDPNSPNAPRQEDLEALAIFGEAEYFIQNGENIDWSDSHRFQPGDREKIKDFLKDAENKQSLLPMLREVVANKRELPIDYLDSKGVDIGIGACKSVVACLETLRFVKKVKPALRAKLTIISPLMEAAVKEGRPIDLLEDERLSVQEYALICKVLAFMKSEHNLILIKLFPSPYKEEFESFYHFGEIFDQYMEIVSDELETPDGTIGFTHIPREARSHGHQGPDLFAKLQSIATHSVYTHASIAYTDNQNVKHLAHVVKHYKNKAIEKEEFCYTDFFKLDWNKIVCSNAKPHLEDFYGENWDINLQKKFSKLSKKLLEDNGRFSGISNPEDRRAHSLFERRYKKNSSTILDRQFQNREMFCTEFVGETLQLLFEQLNKKMDDKLDYYFQGRVIKQFGHGEHENFAAMHPGVLEKEVSKIADRLPPPKALEALVALD